jgi:predicted ribosome quality control (RQC) complex YloA/Tae2 family protein
MTAFNVVRFKVKPGMEEAFLDAHRNIAESWLGMRHANIIKTDEERYRIIAEWEKRGGADCRSASHDCHAQQLPPDA